MPISGLSLFKKKIDHLTNQSQHSEQTLCKQTLALKVSQVSPYA